MKLPRAIPFNLDDTILVTAYILARLPPQDHSGTRFGAISASRQNPWGQDGYQARGFEIAAGRHDQKQASTILPRSSVSV